MKKQPLMSKQQRLSYLLGAYGNGTMSEEQFWRQMKQSGYGEADIDQWCDEYHSKQETRQ